MRLSYDDAVNLAPEKMKNWIVSECGCGLGQASSVCNDIISHPGDEAGAKGWTKFTCIVAGASRRVYHVSAGKSGTSKTATVFFVEYPENVCYVVALGQHSGPSSYKIKYKKDCWNHGNEVELSD